ncbi:MAG: hypothetical protein AB8H47_27960 [Bacteroidia bacterium]
MNNKWILLIVFSLLFSTQTTFGQSQDSSQSKFFVSTSAFMLINLVEQPDPPRFFMLNFGYRFSPKDAIIVEAITWQYFAPLGIPYGPDKGNVDEFFPGYARDYGIGMAYQRFLWKDLYTTFHATPFMQQYFDKDDKKLQTGFQLFLTWRVGYRFQFWQKKLFIEPSVAFTSWPINTNLPDSFQTLEDKWPNYFLFEPGLHLGYNF